MTGHGYRRCRTGFCGGLGTPSLRSLLLGSVAGLLLQGLPAQAGSPGSATLPGGGSVAAGQAGISQSGAKMDISQSSSKAVINWQSFDIGSKAEVDFHQPDSTSMTLNRVTAGDASSIQGTMTANGKVILVNPAGIVFGNGAKVDVGGLVASVLGIRDSDFMAGTLAFSRNGATGSVTNQGRLTAADGGMIALLAPQLRNDGVVQARLGTAVLAAGEAVTLSLDGAGKVGLKVDPATVRTLVDNRGMVMAPDGRVLLSAQAANALLGGSINNSGSIEADSLTAKGGEIVLQASGPITLNGSLDVSGKTGGGKITLAGQDITLGAADRIHASATGGGGDGGSVEMVAVAQTSVGGEVDARAGSQGGNGGWLNSSGNQLTVDHNMSVDTHAPAGLDGTWFLNAAALTVAPGSGGTVSGATLDAALARNNVTLLSSNGDVVVKDGVTWNTGNFLQLSSYHDVAVNAPITNTGKAGIILRADNTGLGSGTVTFGGGAKAGTGGAVSIFYNPAGYVTPTDFSGSIGGGAALTAYMLVNDLDHLQAINTNLAGTYALGKSIDATATAGWNGGAGFLPLGGVGTPLTPFSGLFDGQGHAIANLTINRPTEDVVGLFGYNGGTVRNVALSGGSVRGRNEVGALVGDNINIGTVSGSYYGRILDSSAETPVTGNSDVGGLVGSNTAGISRSHAGGAVTGGDGARNLGGLAGFGDGLIDASDATGTVTAGDNATSLGGLVGSTLIGMTIPFTSLISNSHATGAVHAGNGASALGGLVGNGAGPIKASYATGAVSGGDNASRLGGLVGDNSINSNIAVGTISDSYAKGAVSAGNGASDIGGLVGLNGGGQLFPGQPLGNTLKNSDATGPVTVGANASAVGGLVGENDGTVTGGAAGGMVTAGAGASGVGGLIGINRGPVSASQARGAVTVGDGGNDIGGLIGLNRADLGDSAASGAVKAGDGAHEVGGLVGSNEGGAILRSSASGAVTAGDNSYDVAGLAGRYIHGIGVDSSTASGAVTTGNNTHQIAGLVGFQQETNGISNSAASGAVTAGNDSSAIGGLLGNQVMNAGVTGSHATGPVKAGDRSFAVGGLLGQQYRTGVSDSYATGSVTVGANGGSIGGLVGDSDRSGVTRSYATGTVTGGAGTRSIGGLVGGMEAGISSSFASGAVIAGDGSQGVGGLVGGAFYSGGISNSYASGPVTAGRNATDVGGLAGFLDTNNTVTNAYSTGKVTAGGGSTFVGGLIGESTGTVTNSYWDTETSGQAASAGGTGLTTAQMQAQASFAGWDFTNIWILPAGSFPKLRGIGGQ